MVPPLPTPTVLLLPADAEDREHLARLVARAGARLAEGEQEGDLTLVDASTASGLAALERLCAPGAGDTQILAMVDWSDGAAIAAVEHLGVTDLIGRGALQTELPYRLRKAARRRDARSESSQQRKDLGLLLQLTADYAGTQDVIELLHDVTRRLADELDVLRASLIVLEGEGTGSVIAASDDSGLKDLRIDLSRYPEIREVIRTGEPLLIEDAPSHPLLEGVASEVAAKGIQAIAALPLSVRGRVIGVLLLRASSVKKTFSRREMDFLATVAHATAVALRNARLLETERDQAEREKHARLAAEARALLLQQYEAYFAHLSEGVAVLDDQACVLSLNPAGSKLLEIGVEVARGRHVNALTNPDDDGLLLDMLWSIGRGEVRREIDVTGRTVSGRRLTLSVCAAPMREGGASSIVSFRDVTLQRQMADELRKTKEFLERLIDSSVDAIIAADLRGKVILFNKGAEQICGWTAEEALAQLDVRRLYPDGVARAVMQRLRAPTEGGPGRLGVSRLELVDKRNERVPVNMTASIIYEGKREVATVGIFTDLRDRVQLERKLSDAETRLEESERNAVIVALAGTAAHELNQPLTSVMGYAELLKRKLKEGDFAYRPVDIIHREAERMAEIVRKIGKITRYETKAYIGTSRILDLEKASSHEE